MKTLILSDTELTTERLHIARRIFEDLQNRIVGPRPAVRFLGDMFREFNGATASFAREFFDLAGGEEDLYLVGNHDREIGANRLYPLFPGQVVSVPIVEGNCAYLPAPDRAAFGASRGPEGRRTRDAALSEALEAALISLETQIGSENLGRAILFFHGAVSGDEVAPGQIAAGLTWTIPGARLARWGLAIGGHLHLPSQHGNVYSVGGIANWQFTDRAEQFRALVVDTDTLEVSEIPLLRALIPIELHIEQVDGTPGISFGNDAVAVLPDLSASGRKIAAHLTGFCGVKRGDTLNLKLHVKLPPEQMALLPNEDELKDAIEIASSITIQRLIVSREPVGLSKVRLETADARSLSLKELFTEYMRVNGKAPSPEVQMEVDKGLDWLEESYRPGEGNLGFKPLTLRVNNFRQWEHAELDFSELLGSVAITGDNATGKSNLLEAMLFALYKHSPSSAESIDKDLRLGTTTGSVELEFEAGRSRYRIRRALELGKGGVTCKSELLREFEYVDGMDADGERRKWTLEPVCETAADIDKAISRIVCSYELATATIWHMQRTLDRFVDSTPAEHAKLFLEELSLDRFEPLRLAATNKAEVYVDNNKVLEAKVDELETQIVGDATALEAMPAPEALQNRIEAAERLLALSEEKLAAVRGDRETWITKRAALDKLATDRADLEKRLKSLEASLAQPIEDIGERPKLPIWIGTTDDPIVLENRATELKARREELLEADAANCAAFGKLNGQIAGLEETIGAIQAEIELLEANLKAHEASKSKLEEPTCQGDEAYLGSCPAWLYYSKADRGAEFTKKLEAARERKMLRGADLRLATEKGNEAVKACTVTKDELSAIAPTLREIETQIGDYRNALHAAELWEEKAKAREARDIENGRRILEMGELEAKLELIVHDLENVPMVKEQIGMLDRAVYALTDEIGKARTVAADAKATLQRRADLGSALDAKRARQAEHRATIAANNIKREAWETLAAAMHRSGIPYLLMERMMAAFEREANETLAPAGLSLQVQTVSNTKRGESRDKITLLFTDERGQHPLAQASGAQRTYIGLAGTAALSHVSALLWGSAPEIFVQDEGFDRLHVSRHDIAREMIAAISKKFRRFIFITHVESIADCADVRLRVVSNNGRSELVQ